MRGAEELEALARLYGEAVEVEAVVPVGATDERQAMGSTVVEHLTHAATQVLEEWHLGSLLVVEGRGVVENREVARLAHVRADGAHEPQGIV